MAMKEKTRRRFLSEGDVKEQ